LKQNIKLGVTNRASLDDSGFKLIDCEASLLNLTQNLSNSMIKKTFSDPTAGLTKRKSSLLNENPVKKKLAGGQNSPPNSKKTFELGNS